MRFLALTAAALLLLGVGGCSAPPPGTGTGTPPSPSEPHPGGPDTGAGQCGGLATEELVTIFGIDLTGPDASTGDSDQNGVTWTSTGCDWENDAERFEIDLDISQGSDFPDGSIVCIEPGGVGGVTPVEGVGTRAWWKFDEFDEVEGELRACTDDSMVEIAIDAAAGSITSDELREKAASAIRVVLG